MAYTSLLIQIIVAVVVLSPVLWTVGRWFVGKSKAKFTDAVFIGVLGVVISSVIGFLLPGWMGTILGTIIMIVVWLALIRHFFECSWGKALVIAVVAGILYWIVSLIVSLILVLFGLSALPSMW
jgi:hypothetical protein